MAINNTIELTGNMNKDGVKVITTDNSTFATFSLATTDSYKNDSGEWIQKDPIWHDLITFSSSAIKALEKLSSKDRIKVFASLDYRPLPIEIEVEENGKTTSKVINKKEASIVVRKVEPAALTKKE